MASIIASIVEWIRLRFVKEPYKLSKRFQRDLEGLSKKNPNLEADFRTFLHEFEQEKVKATRMPRCNGAFKLRMKSHEQGKSGAYRVVYFVKFGGRTWFLTIYIKNEKEKLSPKDEKIVREMIAKIKRGEDV